MARLTRNLVSHGLVAALGFMAGIYALPILVAQSHSPAPASLQLAQDAAHYQGTFRRELAGSDPLHWAQGRLFVGDHAIAMVGEMAPGPDYKLYLAPTFVETEADFLALKDKMALVGDVRSFDSFVLSVPGHVNPDTYTTAIIWCESFGRFISAAQYQGGAGL